MTLVEKLVSLPTYQVILAILEDIEKSRQFCRHDFDHFLQVARIGKQLARKHSLPISDDEIYLSAFLHDIGRIVSADISHAEASAILAAPLLTAIDCPDDVAAAVLDAIKGHQYRGKTAPQTLVQLLSLADNLSRHCYACQASEDCYWPEERKNHAPILKETL